MNDNFAFWVVAASRSQLPNTCPNATIRAHNENLGRVEGIAYRNPLGVGIRLASVDAGESGSGSWCTCQLGAREVSHSFARTPLLRIQNRHSISYNTRAHDVNEFCVLRDLTANMYQTHAKFTRSFDNKKILQDPPQDVCHIQFGAAVGFKLVWCPGPGAAFTTFALVDDDGLLLASGTPSGDLPSLRDRRANWQVVDGGKYSTACHRMFPSASE